MNFNGDPIYGIKMLLPGVKYMNSTDDDIFSAAFIIDCIIDYKIHPLADYR